MTTLDETVMISLAASHTATNREVARVRKQVETDWRAKLERSETAAAAKIEKIQADATSRSESDVSAARAEGVRVENERIFGILGLLESNPAGVTHTGNGEFKDLVASWACDPRVTLADATERYKAIAQGYDKAMRSKGLAALQADEEDLDAPNNWFATDETADLAASIKLAGDFVEKSGALDGRGIL